MLIWGSGTKLVGLSAGGFVASVDLEGDGLPCTTHQTGGSRVGATEPHCVDCCRRLGTVPKLAFIMESLM